MAAVRFSVKSAWLLVWCVTSSIGAGFGVIAWVAVGSILEAAVGGAESVLTAMAAGSAFGAVLGFGQWLALRGSVDHAGRWIIASIVGYGIDFVLGATLLPSEAGVGARAGEQILLGAVLGFAVALAPATLQWLLVLRSQIPGSVWWVPLSLAAWGLGFAVSFSLRLLLGELTFVAGPVVAIALTGLGMRRWLPVVPERSET